MIDSATPRPYEQWRKVPPDRAEDAAYTFAYNLMQHCRSEALKASDSATLPKTRRSWTSESPKRLIPRFLEGYCQGEGAFCRRHIPPRQTGQSSERHKKKCPISVKKMGRAQRLSIPLRQHSDRRWTNAIGGGVGSVELLQQSRLIVRRSRR